MRIKSHPTVLSFCFVCAFFFRTSIAPAAPLSSESPGLEVVVMDVGQGDGIFLRTPGNKNILIDAGPDAGRGVLPFLRVRKIDHIDVMLVTHPHSDHMGGAVAVMEYCPVREVLDSGKNHPTPPYRDMLATIRKKGIAYRQPRAGDALAWDPALNVKVLHPDRPDYDNVNDNSIVVRVVYDKISFLFTGDAEKAAEKTILSRFGGELKSDVLKVGHHGSLTSSQPAFLRAVQPRYALISCGYKNSFWHPRPQTLENLEGIGARVLRTDLDGFLIFKTDGQSIRWSRTPLPFPKTDFDPGNTRDLNSTDWFGKAEPRGIGVALSAAPGENLWADAFDGPRWTRPLPSADEWSCAVSLTPAQGYKTEAGLILMENAKNFILFGIQEERMTSLTVIQNGHVKLGPELLVSRPSQIGFRKTVRGLEALALDDDKNTWRILWNLGPKNMLHLGDAARLGLYAKSWGHTPAAANFKDFKLNPPQ